MSVKMDIRPRPRKQNVGIPTGSSRNRITSLPTRSFPPTLTSPSTPTSPSRYGHSAAARELKDVLERKIEDLSRQLTEEKQSTRQCRMSISRLQRELTRTKANTSRQGKEQLSKELEHEKMLRVEAERRLHDMTRESEGCRSRLEVLQGEFRKMEDSVRDMLQYKSKIDQLKQEKSSLSVTYQNNIHKFKNHMTDLERENMVLLNECKKLESQMSTKTDGRDRSKLLLERLKMIEGENSALVLENEQQRGQYEKCLDEIANQVVQALLAQKMLREECVKLQSRVGDLEVQNRQMCVMFHQRMKMAAEVAQQHNFELPCNTDIFQLGSVESLQSMFSEQMSENIPSMHQMSSPPPWLQERLPGDRHSIISYTGSVTSTPEYDFDNLPPPRIINCRTEIETEFPATPSSPKSKHVNIIERQSETKRSSSTSSLTSTNRGPTKPRTRSTSSLSKARGLSVISPQTLSQSHESGIQEVLTTTNRLSYTQSNSNNSLTTNQNGSMTISTNQGVELEQSVPLDRSNPSISNHVSQSVSQGHVSRSVSKLPIHPNTGKTKDETQLRRNSLKAEYSIRMGCQSTVSKQNPTGPVSNLKPPQSRSPCTVGSRSPCTVGSRSSPVTTTNGQGHSRSPSATSTGSSKSSVSSSKSKTSKIPSIFKTNGAKPSSKENITKSSANPKGKSAKTDNSGSKIKMKTGIKDAKQSSKTVTPATKLVPPKSPTMRYSGIRTTLKNDTSPRASPDLKPETNIQSSQGHTSVSPGACSVSKNSTDKSGEITKPPLPVKGEKPHRNENHYPIMGVMNLSHTSPKSEGSEQVYANMITVPSTFSSALVQSSQSFDNVDVDTSTVQCESSEWTKAKYFYDYSDEDSDFNRPVSKDYSIASTVSLDELLDQTLENIETPVDGGDLSAEYFLYNSAQGIKQLKHNSRKKKASDSLVTPTGDNVNNSNKDQSHVVNFNNSQNENINHIGNNAKNGNITKNGNFAKNGNINKSGNITKNGNNARPGNIVPRNVNNDKDTVNAAISNTTDMVDSVERLRGKPDIVKDTEECEQRKLQKSLTISQIPGSSIPGYRAKRPKSLILGANDKKFLYCEYGSSSSSDTSDEEWSYQFSYAKNIKQQEIQSKIAKSLKSGQAKIIETPKNTGEINEIGAEKTQNDKTYNIGLQMSKSEGNLPKPLVAKKPSKIPPPVANKPIRRQSSPAVTDNSIPRPRSVEICVNTVLSSSNAVTCNYSTYLDKSVSKAESERFLSLTGNEGLLSKLHNSDTTFDEVKVERSGSKDDGYSTMSSDIQPELMEKYSDVLESSTNSNDVRNSNLSLSSQNSISSEDRFSNHGSLGRVRAMKLKYELDNHRSPEREMVSPVLSPPMSPARSLLTSPKHVTMTTSKLHHNTDIAVTKATSTASSCKIPKPKMGTYSSKEGIENKPRSGIPVQKCSMKSDLQKKSVNKKDPIKPPSIADSQTINVKTTDQPSINSTIPFSPERSTSCDISQNTNIYTSPYVTNIPKTSTPVNVVEQFSQLTTFDPVIDPLAFLREGSYDSNSSLSDRGSDLTSLHISEDNILSDIPEEKDGYESSVGRHSNNTSISSLPTVHAKKSPQRSHHSGHTHHQVSKVKFSMTLKKYWSSLEGLVRARSNSDYEKQKEAKECADYEELYGGCLNIETLMERSSSESDLYSRGDKPDVTLLPRLQRSSSTGDITIDEISVEERLQVILKQNVLQQISKNVESADREDANFNNFVELLIQRGHVMETKTALGDRRVAKNESRSLNKMAVSTFSSQTLAADNRAAYFATVEEKQGGQLCQTSETSQGTPLCQTSETSQGTQLCQTSETSQGTQLCQTSETSQGTPVGEEQKKFNSQFYSLCNSGSSKSISEKSENHGNDLNVRINQNDTINSSKTQDLAINNNNTVHTCQKGDTNCGKCIDERNRNDFEDISRQLETLSKTVNELHRSLSSLNSENTESGSESNEGDSVLTSAIGNKDIDGYQWVEDEFFLSPYGGEVILGGSPFSNTGASCDWMNEYSVDNVNNFDEFGGNEGLHEEPVTDITDITDILPELTGNSNKKGVTKSTKTKIKPPINSILAQSIDKEGNFDSHHFISRRLLLEEERRKALKLNDNITETKSPAHNAVQSPRLKRSKIPPPKPIKPSTIGNRVVHKEDLRMTPEKDVDDLETLDEKKQATFESTLTYAGSQDSLDDNIGVDNVMCHRLIGGKGHNVAARNVPIQNSRPSLDFSPNQFTRYSDVERQAVAAFDFLHDMSSSVSSNQSNEPKISHDQLSRMEEKKVAMTVANGYRNQMDQSTTSNESRASPVKRNRRKLRPKTRKDPKGSFNQGNKYRHKFSSTSGDSNFDISESDVTCSDSESNAEDERMKLNQNDKVSYVSKNMTYV